MAFACAVCVLHITNWSDVTKSFLNAINPEFAVVSCGIDNSFGHPSNEVVNNLIEIDCKILRTDTMGSVVMFENNGDIKAISGFNFVTNIYFEWWIFVVSFELILVFLLFVKI